MINRGETEKRKTATCTQRITDGVIPVNTFPIYYVFVILFKINKLLRIKLKTGKSSHCKPIPPISK